MEQGVRTLCPYCGVGCGLEVIGNKIRGDRAHPSSLGMVCVKGATVLEAIDRDRLLYPLYRQNLADSFERISWGLLSWLPIGFVLSWQLRGLTAFVCMVLDSGKRKIIMLPKNWSRDVWAPITSTPIPAYVCLVLCLPTWTVWAVMVLPVFMRIWNWLIVPFSLALMPNSNG